MAGKNVSSICEEMSMLLCSYEALEGLMATEDGQSSATIVLLNNLNRQLRCAVGQMDDLGLVE